MLSAAIILLIFGAYIRQWFVIGSNRNQWSTFQFIQVGAGIGLFLIALHGTVDFNWHIPANVAYTAFLAALFFHRSTHVNIHKTQIDAQQESRQQETSDNAGRLLPETPPEPVNPFLE